MITIAVIIAIVLFVEHFLSPRVGTTREGKVLLWYGTNSNRRYVVLFEL